MKTYIASPKDIERKWYIIDAEDMVLGRVSTEIAKILRERKILTLRYGLFDSDIYTQKEISSMMNISRSYVSRLEKRALLKLYKEFYKHNKKDL